MRLKIVFTFAASLPFFAFAKEKTRTVQDSQTPSITRTVTDDENIDEPVVEEDEVNFNGKTDCVQKKQQTEDAHLTNLAQKSIGDVLNEVYLKQLICYPQLANPFEDEADDNPYFMYLTNRVKNTSMLTKEEPNPWEDELPKEFLMGYTNLWVCERIFLFHSTEQMDYGDYKLIMRKKGVEPDTPIVNNLLLIVGKGDYYGTKVYSQLPSEKNFSQNNAISIMNDLQSEGFTIYACIGVKVLHNLMWH
ncbi:MAG: hypothetical protein IKP37_12665 [Paludibacteraceae bacterium]|nr:hypothetical protein [Paludibacteraceae bacterium]